MNQALRFFLLIMLPDPFEFKLRLIIMQYHF